MGDNSTVLVSRGPHCNDHCLWPVKVTDKGQAGPTVPPRTQQVFANGCREWNPCQTSLIRLFFRRATHQTPWGDQVRPWGHLDWRFQRGVNKFFQYIIDTNTRDRNENRSLRVEMLRFFKCFTIVRKETGFRVVKRAYTKLCTQNTLNYTHCLH